MSRFSLSALAFALAGMAFVPVAGASTYNAGYVSYDQVTPTTAEFDIVNLTGPNSSGDASFPITTSVSLSSLSLLVNYSSGPSETFGSSYFTLASDGLSFNGTPESTTSGQPGGFMGAISATLTGDFDTTSVMLFDGTTVTIGPSFAATITDVSGFANGDAALITAASGTTPPPPVVPEPESLVLVGTGLMALMALRRRLRCPSWRKAIVSTVLFAGTIAVFLAPGSASAAVVSVKLTAAAAPSSGLAGITTVHVTATGLPTGSIPASGITVSLSTGCGGASPTKATASSVSALPGGAGDLIYFLIPPSLGAGTYQVSVSGTAGGTAFASSDCSTLAVTASTPSLASCVPTSSIAVTVGTNVMAYVPYGYWEGGVAGLAAVAIEGSSAGTSKKIATTGIVNSCAANSAATPAQVICTENNTNVDIITGTTLTSTLTSGANIEAGFSGGNCYNCGVAIDAANSRAVIAMGLSGGGGSGVQALNLANNTFDAGFPLLHYVSEDISIDPTNKWVLSPAEDGVYDILTIDTTGGKYNLKEYGNYVGSELDSAAEDCTTGIALASIEFSDQIYITDLSQSKFTAGSPGTWTAPGQTLNLSDGGYSAGTCGITSAPGTAHLAAVTGEFGGASYAILQLPSTSGPGKGTPNLADYAYVSALPNTPDGLLFSAGYDPHTITAYTSPNGTQKSYTLMVDYAKGYPSYVAQVDMKCVLAAPRTGGAGSHTVSPSTTSGQTAADSCVKYFPVAAP